MPRHTRFVVALLAPLCGMGACTVTPRIEVYNHSGAPVRIIAGTDSRLLGAGDTWTFDYPAQPPGEVRVCRNGRLLRYAVPCPPVNADYRNYYHGTAFLFLRIRLRVQLEPDGQLRILPRGERFPVPGTTAQLPPFPLTPEELGEC